MPTRVLPQVLLLMPLFVIAACAAASRAAEGFSPAQATSAPMEGENRAEMARAVVAMGDEIMRAQKLRLDDKPEEALEAVRASIPTVERVYRPGQVLRVHMEGLRRELEKVTLASSEQRKLYAKLSKHVDDGIEALKSGRMSQAEGFFGKALADCESLDLACPYALPHALQGGATADLYYGRYRNAMDKLRRAAVNHEELAGRDCVPCAVCLGSLGWCHAELGQHVDAEPLVREAATSLIKLGMYEDYMLVDPLLGLGHVLVARGEYAEAEAVLLRATAILKKSGRERSLLMASLHVAMATIRQAEGDPEAAKLAMESAAAIFAAHQKHTVFFPVYTRAAQVYRSLDMIDEAVAMERRVEGSKVALPQDIWTELK